MSNTTKSVPLINPAAYPQMIELFKDSITRHNADVHAAEEMIETLDEQRSLPYLTTREAELVIEALTMLVANREESVEALIAGIEELSPE